MTYNGKWLRVRVIKAILFDARRIAVVKGRKESQGKEMEA